MTVLLFWNSRNEPGPEPTQFRWHIHDILHVIICILHFSVVWVLQGSFVVYFALYHRYVLLVLPAISIGTNLVVYFGYFIRWWLILFVCFVFEGSISLIYTALAIVLITESNVYDYYRQSSIFPEFYSDDFRFLGILMLCCAICQLLFAYVVWRGFRSHIDIFYWLPDERTKRDLKWLLSIIFIQIVIASGVLAFVLGLKN